MKASPEASHHRDLIVRWRRGIDCPAIYASRYFATKGGLISCGPDILDQYRRADGYVDRTLKGEKPADLPVQAPTKYELVINLKTAKIVGIEVPPSLQARADESDRIRAALLRLLTAACGTTRTNRSPLDMSVNWGIVLQKYFEHFVAQH